VPARVAVAEAVVAASVASVMALEVPPGQSFYEAINATYR